MWKTIKALAVLGFLLPVLVSGEEIVVPAGYTIENIQLSTTEAEGAALAISPTDSNLLYAVVGGFEPQKVVRVDLSQQPPLVTDFATGAFNLIGADDEDDALDSRFGNIGGLAVLHTGEVIIVDNYLDTIFIARDLNFDGDAQDIINDGGTTTSEVQILIAPINTLPGSGWGGFTGQQAEVDANDTVYIVTADGGGLGEVLRITDPATSPAISIWFEGLDYGAGLGFDSRGRLYVGNSSWPSGAAIYWTQDFSNPPDGDALDPDESGLVTDAISGIYDLAVDADNFLYITNGRYVQKINPANGEISNFAIFPLWTFLGDIVFTSQTNPFRPIPGEHIAKMIIADGNFDGNLTVISPKPSTGVGCGKWLMYE